MLWAKERNIQRLRSDRQVGPPEKEQLRQWVGIFEARGINDEEQVHSVLDAARTAADRFGQWRNWGFLTLQVQLAAENFGKAYTPNVEQYQPSRTLMPEQPDSLWSKAKARIRSQIPDVAFLNWFACTWQIMRCGSEIEVAVPDEPTGACLKDGYDHLISAALSELGVEKIRFVVRDPLEEERWKRREE
jgi:hypothetical protein